MCKHDRCIANVCECSDLFGLLVLCLCVCVMIRQKCWQLNSPRFSRTIYVNARTAERTEFRVLVLSAHTKPSLLSRLYLTRELSCSPCLHMVQWRRYESGMWQRQIVCFLFCSALHTASVPCALLLPKPMRLNAVTNTSRTGVCKSHKLHEQKIDIAYAGRIIQPPTLVGAFYEHTRARVNCGVCHDVYGMPKCDLFCRRGGRAREHTQLKHTHENKQAPPPS